jgi:Tol biopolymer transport system component
MLPHDTPDAVATVVASIKITLTAEAARMPTATPTHTAPPTATATPTDTPTPTPLPPPRLEGQILDAVSSDPLPGAQVAAGERQTTTDSEGRFLFTDLAPGQYTVLVTSADHDPVLSGIVDLRAGGQAVVDAALPAVGTGEYPRDPMASNQIDPAGAPTAQEAERLARLQGFQGEVVSVGEVMLEGEYLVNYKKGDTIRSAMATLNHPAWELVDEAGQAWYIIRVCGNLAVVRAPQVEVPVQCVARPNPVVTVGSQAVNAYTCPSETCSVAVELPAGWHGVALACAPGCGWLRVQCPGVDGSCWVRRDWLQTWGELAELPVVPVAVSGQIAFFSDRDSPGYGEIFLMNPDGSHQVRLTSDLRLPPVSRGSASWVISLRWSPALRRFFFNSGNNGRFYTVHADGSGGMLVAEKIVGIDTAPDGQQIVSAIYGITSYRSDIVIMSTDATGRTILTNDAVRASLGLAPDSQLLGPTWSPDGSAIAFYSHSPDHICVLNVDRSGPRVLASEMYSTAGLHMDWSPDGRHILFPEVAQVGILDVTSGNIRYLAEDGTHATWSPDGSRILVSRPFSGKEAQIWVLDADGSGLTQLTFEGLNCCPVWLP